MLNESGNVKVTSTWNDAFCTNFKVRFQPSDVHTALAVAFYEAGKYIESLGTDRTVEDVTVQAIQDTWWVSIYTRKKN